MARVIDRLTSRAGFLLLENGAYLLLESGGRIIIDDTQVTAHVDTNTMPTKTVPRTLGFVRRATRPFQT